MMDDLVYQQLTITFAEPPSWPAVLEKISAWPDLTIVNAANTPAGPFLLFLPDNVLAMTDSGETTLYLEALPLTTFQQLLLEQLTQLQAKTKDLKKQLCYRYPDNLLNEIQEHLSICQIITLFLSCGQSQYPHEPISAGLLQLQKYIEQLTLSAFHYDDNVRCLDDLTYTLQPCLAQLTSYLQDHELASKSK